MSKRVILLCNYSTIHTKLTGWLDKAWTFFRIFCYQDDSDANYNDDAGRVIRLDKTCEKVGSDVCPEECFFLVYPLTFTNILALLAWQQI